jgi:hypothetical protein
MWTNLMVETLPYIEETNLQTLCRKGLADGDAIPEPIRLWYHIRDRC